ncbi:MAG: hypothetical protein EPN75_00445 [Beijerinckiaceae bacterium]|nr:MAG: hypothetical protein EPN75_00445 [Beijerinckiaceae bacterium]
MPKSLDANTREALVDRLAAIEHERWSHWQRYMHGKATRQEDGALLIPADIVARWEKQIATAYADLPPDEQESDKEQVERYLPIIEEAFDSE